LPSWGPAVLCPYERSVAPQRAGAYRRRVVGYNHRETFSPDIGMKLARQQVLGSLILAVIVLIILLIRAWPYLFHK
jgi:hypothetical protein